MKRCVCVILLMGMLLCALSVSLSAEEYTSAEQIPIAEDEDMNFPAVVDNILMDKAFIAESERLTDRQVQFIIDSCADQLTSDDVTLVPVDTQTILQVPTLKQRSSVECTSEYVYSTYYNQGVKYQWIHYLDGRVEKTVSYNYEERTAEFVNCTYTIVNDNNEILMKNRFEIEDDDAVINITDVLFGMAIAVFLMLVVFAIVRKIKE